jgi:hypothetical protein
MKITKILGNGVDMMLSLCFRCVNFCSLHSLYLVMCAGVSI